MYLTESLTLVNKITTQRFHFADDTSCYCTVTAIVLRFASYAASVRQQKQDITLTKCTLGLVG